MTISRFHKTFKDIDKARAFHAKKGGYLYVVDDTFVVTLTPPWEMIVFTSDDELGKFCELMGQFDHDETQFDFARFKAIRSSNGNLTTVEIFWEEYDEGPEWAVRYTVDDKRSMFTLHERFGFRLRYPASAEQLFEAVRRVGKFFGKDIDYDSIDVTSDSAQWGI